jgi:4'-phosphopantetheinyl transferase EntD
MLTDSPFTGIAFPDGIAFALLGPENAAPPPLPEEQRLLSPKALPERAAEFARGRAAARRALETLGLPDAAWQAILREGPRAPRWPPGVIGAIAHSAGWAAAAVARRGRLRGLGLDLERVRPVRARLAAKIARPEERLAWEALSEPHRALAFALLFSAKESIYKALHPVTGIFLGYQDANVEFPTLLSPNLRRPAGPSVAFPLHHGAGKNGGEADLGGYDFPIEFTWTLHEPCGSDFPVGFRGGGRGWAGGGLVLTAAWV